MGMEGSAWPVSAPYVVYGGLNLLVCDLGSSALANTWVIPVLRTLEAAAETTNGADLTDGGAVPDGLTSNFGALNAFAASATSSTANNYATAGAKRVGWFMLIGSDAMLNKLTGYALGL